MPVILDRMRLGKAGAAATGFALGAFLCLACGDVLAAVATREQTPAADDSDPDRSRRVIEWERRRVERGGYAHFYGSLAVGRGLRLNNPYRLERVIGDDTEGLSLSALYADVAGGWLAGDPMGLQHGPGANFSLAITGIRQEVLTPGYRVLFRFDSPWTLSSRLGIPIVLEPDLSSGFEVGLAAIHRLLSGLGLYAELIVSAFLGAATYEVDTTVIPVISLQLGAWMDYEVLP